MPRYRLPEALGGGEVEATEWWSGCAGANREYRIAGTSISFSMPSHSPLEEVSPPLPPEPPVGSVVLDGKGRAWQRVGPPNEDHQGCRWWSSHDVTDDTWAGLNQGYAPLTRLVPAAEPVTLPWRGNGVVVEQTIDGAGPGSFVHVSTKDASYGFCHLKPDVAREMARALWTAAEQAEATS